MILTFSFKIHQLSFFLFVKNRQKKVKRRQIILVETWKEVKKKKKTCRRSNITYQIYGMRSWRLVFWSSIIDHNPSKLFVASYEPKWNLTFVIHFVLAGTDQLRCRMNFLNPLCASCYLQFEVSEAGSFRNGWFCGPSFVDCLVEVNFVVLLGSDLSWPVLWSETVMATDGLDIHN